MAKLIKLVERLLQTKANLFREQNEHLYEDEIDGAVTVALSRWSAKSY